MEKDNNNDKLLVIHLNPGFLMGEKYIRRT